MGLLDSVIGALSGVRSTSGSGDMLGIVLQMLADDGEDTVDSSHPTDLGFVHQSDAFEPVLRKALRAPGAE